MIQNPRAGAGWRAPCRCGGVYVPAGPDPRTVASVRSRAESAAAAENTRSLCLLLVAESYRLPGRLPTGLAARQDGFAVRRVSKPSVGALLCQRSSESTAVPCAWTGGSAP